MFQPQPSPLSPFYSHFVGASNAVDGINFDYPDSVSGRVNSGGPVLLTDPIFNSIDSGNSGGAQLNFANSRPLRRPSHPRRNNNKMDNISGNEYEAQQQAALQYQPDLKGPLVGNKTSSHAITAEYQKAHPVYVAKTIDLPQTYSHYRPIIGDGNCGWRAIAFSYFEILQKLGDKAKIESEIERMNSMTKFINSVTGYSEFVFEDMREVVTTLLQQIADTVHLGPTTDANSIILQTLNQEVESNYAVYFFKLLASSWMQSYPENYEAFITEAASVEDYRKNYIEPVSSEMDNLGLNLLFEVLLKPAGIAVEYVYLDLSPGSRANTHQLDNGLSGDPNSAPLGPNAPTIYLLYRPGHYDILYKEPVQSMPMLPPDLSQNQPLQIHRVHNIGHHDTQWEPTNFADNPLDFGLLSQIPGMSFGLSSNHGFPSLDYNDMPASTYAMSPSATTQHSMSPTSPGGMFPNPLPPMTPSHSQGPISPQSFPPPQHSHSMPLPSSPADPKMAPFSSLHSLQSHHSPISPVTTSHHQQLPPPSTHFSAQEPVQMRPSKYVVEDKYLHHEQRQPETKEFAQSHFNTRHYNNPEFEPEQWRPEDAEDDDGGSGSGRGHRGGKRTSRKGRSRVNTDDD